jgi:hypothetical protein
MRGPAEPGERGLDHDLTNRRRGNGTVVLVDDLKPRHCPSATAMLTRPA